MHINPFRVDGSYYRLFTYWQKKQYVTKQELRQLGFNNYDINAILSPREEGKCKGDCRGNMAVHGDKFYAEKHGKVFRLRWRRIQLEPFTIISHPKVESRKLLVKRHIGVGV
jgi:DNA-binding transcriptional MerR regulator